MNRISNPQPSKPLPTLLAPKPKPERGSQAEPLRRPLRSGQVLPAWSMIRNTGMLGMVVAVPTGLGMAVGVWIDTLWPNAHSWFSILAPVGFALGCLCAVFWSYIDQKS